VNEFMRHQRGVSEVRSEVRKVIFSRPIFARFVVLDAEMRKLIAEGQQEVVLAVVRCAEQSMSFANDLTVFLYERRRRVQSFVRVRRDFEIMRRASARAEIDSPKVASSKYWRIHQGRQGNCFEIDGIVIRCRNRKRCTELP